MTIQEGFKAVSNAMFGKPEDRSVGNCDRCKQPLIVCPMRGTAQVKHTYKFGWKDGPECPPFGILMGRVGLQFNWEAKLCDNCISSLGVWLKGNLVPAVSVPDVPSVVPSSETVPELDKIGKIKQLVLQIQQVREEYRQNESKWDSLRKIREALCAKDVELSRELRDLYLGDAAVEGPHKTFVFIVGIGMEHYLVDLRDISPNETARVYQVPVLTNLIPGLYIYGGT
jgi:hypothetical protein